MLQIVPFGSASDQRCCTFFFFRYCSQKNGCWTTWITWKQSRRCKTSKHAAQLVHTNMQASLESWGVSKGGGVAERPSLRRAMMLVITNTDQNVVITPVLTLAKCDEQLVCSRERVCQLACFGMMPSTIYFCFDLQKGEKAKREILDCVKVCVGYMTD